MNHGLILNIQRFSVHDGPGIRTLVFMKGCPLRCVWCSNPESMKPDPELSIVKTRCVKCGKCVGVCPQGAIKISAAGDIITDREQCVACGECVNACLYDVREIAGKSLTIEQVLREVEADREFYSHSEGGITVGGGEPTQQHTFVRNLLTQCHERWLHTAMETCGQAPWEHLKGILEHVDFLLYDIKHMDPEIHKRLTGVSNHLILKNLEKIVSDGVVPEVVVRVPVVPDLNDSEINIAALCEYISKLRGNIKGIELLPYHRLGMSKYENFGMEYQLKHTPNLNDDSLNKLKTIIDSFGLTMNW